MVKSLALDSNKCNKKKAERMRAEDDVYSRRPIKISLTLLSKVQKVYSQLPPTS